MDSSALAVAVAVLLHVGGACVLQLAQVPLPPPRSPGFLNGLSPATPDAAIAQLRPATARLPSLSGASRLQRLGVRSLQLIVGPQALEARSRLNSTALSRACWPSLTPACPLPGAAGDPEYAGWEQAVSGTLTEVHQQGLADFVRYDVWNEPNFVGGPGTGGGGWPYPSGAYPHPPAGRPDYSAFWEVWNRAVRLIRSRQPGAVVVGPSAAPGPGVPEGDPAGWQPQRAWLEAFLLQAAANGTLPDILSWHDYTGQPGMAGSMISEIRSWMAQQGLPALPIGYNEAVDSRHAQSAGYHVALMVELLEAAADHIVLGCWRQPDQPPVSTCWDGTLDGLLDPSFGRRPSWWALRWLAELPAERFRLTGPAECAVAGLVASNGSLALLGRWAAGSSGGAVRLGLGPGAANRPVELRRVPGCANLSVPCPAVAAPRVDPTVTHVPPDGELRISLDIAEAVQIKIL